MNNDRVYDFIVDGEMEFDYNDFEEIFIKKVY